MILRIRIARAATEFLKDVAVGVSLGVGLVLLGATLVLLRPTFGVLAATLTRLLAR
jgi:hypothetical protein